ncbi:ESX secretion-associated protein EspG [Mycolicibacillus parakoreensis]|uniref:ESX secretion-associated protein EspG n=1 Tax=Mycolicibacillus parakoreensis TaxID=1069221 RepID=A0ABY3U2Y9_9MYCO|nr:ESX secretion-associated protein EspG [Mycolicibacillus parakoreensis]MCV7314237.1 ESX secretion-associated protein EspG [Mycolicibacillus parakoreensis]ULN52950.1 ESX secretion-associated protein EspG [Mycolicibacillus parakoreensis]HLR99565.1 ESX secretion-associated protein EspG [Mycolicibacillus parakoreensis]
MSQHQAVEVTTEQAWFLADLLRAGTYPWKLAITTPYADPGDHAAVAQRCTEELTGQGIVDARGHVLPVVADAIRTTCRSRQRLEWLTVIDQDQILRGVLARADTSGEAVVALRHAQMVTFTPLHIDSGLALVPVVTAGLDDQPPARFTEFSLPMEVGVALDKRIAAGADIVAELVDLGVPESDAQVMEIARIGDHPFTEITAQETSNGSSRATDVGVTVINTEIGRILVSTAADEPRAGGESVFAPAEPLAVAVALRELTDRLPERNWFPDENLTI